jgi:hypothetical protein
VLYLRNDYQQCLRKRNDITELTLLWCFFFSNFEDSKSCGWTTLQEVHQFLPLTSDASFIKRHRDTFKKSTYVKNFELMPTMFQQELRALWSDLHSASIMRRSGAGAGDLVIQANEDNYCCINVTPSLPAHVYKDNCYDLATVDKKHTENVSLVVMDMPYGYHGATHMWDQVAVTEHQIKTSVSLALSKCSHSKRLTVAIFCDITMHPRVSAVISTLCDRHVTLYWRKINPMGTGNRDGGYDQCMELIVLGFVKCDRDGEAFPAFSNYINWTVGEDRANFLAARPAIKKQRVKLESGVSVVLNPCQKPVHLLVQLITRLTRPGDAVLDLFSGTGSILFIFWGFVVVFLSFTYIVEFKNFFNEF